MLNGGIFDSHAHYDDGAFEPDREQVIRKVRAAGVTHILNCGADLRSSVASVELAATHPEFHAAVGVHPENAAEYPAVRDEIAALATRGEVVAIGEIGLDYHYGTDDTALQKEIFCDQLALAKRLNLPAVIHERDALNDTLDILKGYDGAGVLHCFCQSPQIAKILLDRGFYLGIGGLVTFKNARKIVEAVLYAPLQRLLLETDCPYLAPTPHRGERNDSSYLTLTAQRLAEIKNVTVEQVIEVTAQSAMSLFKIQHGRNSSCSK